jgi:CheY-like chemotaxis protein/CHASE3 domain sensor protein/putative methionine-R-sulfoxide reductase with GAF domain
MKITLGQKILAGFIFSTLVLIVVAILSFRNGEKVIDAAQWVRHTQKVLYEFDQLLLYCVNAETGERGYAITGREEYLEPFKLAGLEVTKHVSLLQDLTRDNPVQQKNIKELDERITAFMQRMEYVINIRREHGFEKTRDLILSDVGKNMLDDIRTLIGDAMRLENDLLEKREKISDADTREFNRVFMILLLIIALVLISVYIVITINLRALKKAERETADKNWVLEGSGKLAEGMQGNKNPLELASAVVSHLATYINLSTAAFYLADDDGAGLTLIDGYALGGETEKRRIRFGEGLAGQAAKENAMKMVRDIPGNHLSLNTSLGIIKPGCIVAQPLLFENKVVGVLELGALHDFSTLKLDYLRLISGPAGIAIVSAQARKRTADLLEETQHLAEELNAQQEELRQSNDELYQKTSLLEESEQELKAQQEELEQTNKELAYKADMLEEQRDKIENSRMLIEAKAQEVELISKYKSEFLANMSHELRTPLNSILILSQLLTENKNNTLGEKEANFSKSIYNSGNDLLNLINEILDLSKIESGKMELEVGTVKLSEITEQISSIFAEMAKNKALHFRIDVDGALAGISVKTDRQRVEQILKNLLSNAFKFTPRDGSVTLHIGNSKATWPGKAQLQSAHMLAFSVSDTGIGIPENKRAVIFEAFQQADGSTKRQYGGTGLGLSISRELARALGGEIGLESQEGRGSTFTLYLPVVFDAAMSVSEKEVQVNEAKTEAGRKIQVPIPVVAGDPGYADDDRNNISPGDRLILIIEDDETFAEILLDFVRRRNYKGVIARQGNMGMSYARHYKPDAILLDIRLPVMDGIEVLKQIKNDPDLRHIPVQIMSVEDKKARGFELGAFDFIKKPVSTDDLQRAFDRVEKFIQKKLKKLLVVEDNRTQSEAIIELVGSSDVQCVPAYTGSDAYAMLEKDEFDCMIVDLNLPDMSGFDLLEKIKSNRDLNSIPVVVYTGKDLSREENNRLTKLANTVVLKTANSHERLLDETVLFLHKVESNLPKEKQNIIRKLHRTDEILRNKKILLVDDDMRNIYSLSNVLEDEGIHCIIAENGRVALEELARHSDIDLVLMDVMMPEMDGYEATMQIRKTPGIQQIPIIALTAKAMKGDREKCLAAGMSDYITKPVNVAQLLSLMRVWLYK